MSPCGILIFSVQQNTSSMHPHDLILSLLFLSCTSYSRVLSPLSLMCTLYVMKESRWCSVLYEWLSGCYIKTRSCIIYCNYWYWCLTQCCEEAMWMDLSLASWGVSWKFGTISLYYFCDIDLIEDFWELSSDFEGHSWWCYLGWWFLELGTDMELLS